MKVKKKIHNAGGKGQNTDSAHKAAPRLQGAQNTKMLPARRVSRTAKSTKASNEGKGKIEHRSLLGGTRETKVTDAKKGTCLCTFTCAFCSGSIF